MEDKICRLHLPGGRVWEFSYGRLRAGAAVIILLFMLFVGATAYLYYCLADYRREAQEFAEYKLHKQEQQSKLRRLVQDNEKMLRDMAEIVNLEQKLRRALLRDSAAGKPGSDMAAGGTASFSSSYTGVGGPAHMDGAAAMAVLQVQNTNIRRRLNTAKASVGQLLGEAEKRRGTLAFFPDCWPTEGGAVSSGYGARTGPIEGGDDWHPGIDIAVDFGVPVYAAGAGTIEQAGWDGAYGRSVRIDHGNGYRSVYGHMSSLAVAAGQQVIKGEIIGFVGSTGYSTGPHLHYEVLADGQNIDPFYILRKR